MFTQPLKIKLSEDMSGNKGRIQLLRTGKFAHEWYGTLEFNDSVFYEMIKNFSNNVRGIEIAVNYSHIKGGEAAGWIENLEYIDGNLYADVNWTDEAKEKIADNRFKYISAEFETNYEDVETGQKYGYVLAGAALTNIPFIKNMDRVLSEIDSLPESEQNKIKDFFENSKKENEKMKFNELLDAVQNLSEDEAGKIKEALGVEVKAESQDVKLSEENADLKAQLDEAKKEIQFSEMLTAGQVVPSQKEAFLKGDMKAFAENAVKVNMQAAGTDQNDFAENESKEEMTSDQAQSKILEFAQEIAKEKSVALCEAISQARFENPEIVSKI